jgi:hypothetical protein
VRLTEAHEDYTRQHQNLRTENGVRYGDVVEAVNFPYAASVPGSTRPRSPRSPGRRRAPTR